MKRLSTITCLLTLLIIVFVLSVIAHGEKQAVLSVETSASGKQYLAYGGEPLLAFGPGDEWRLISRDDFESTRRWAKWQKDNGMNLIRAYPTSVPVPNGLHPFKEKDGKWDVDAWNDEYFQNMSRFFSVLEEYGIVVHLQLWQVVWFKEDRAERWANNYLNPVNNINEWTKAYQHGRDYINAPSDSPAGRHRKEWIMHVLKAVEGHRNVWIDVINELENAGIGSLDWACEVVSWIREWEQGNSQKLLIGVGMCNYNHERFKPYEQYYDLLIFNELHRDQTLRAIKEFRKPAVTVRSSDGSNRREDYLFLDTASSTPHHQTRYRTLCYRSIFSNVQSIGAYWKQEVSVSDYADLKNLPIYARSLRKFWEKINPFWHKLEVDDTIVTKKPTPYGYGMKSESLYAVYLECGSHTSDNQYPEFKVRIKCPFEKFRIEIFHPHSGETHIIVDGKRDRSDIVIPAPAFIDDVVILIWNKD